MAYSKEEIEKIKQAKKEWEQGPVKKALSRFGVDKPFNQYYTPADLPEDFDFLENVGFPGQFPYTTGRYPVVSTGTAWGRGSSKGAKMKAKRAGRYTGFGTTEDTRDFYLMTQEKGLRVGGPNIAFDLPTQCGYDSDDPFSEGEVGKVGVAVDTLQDLETIYEAFTGDMDLDKIASNYTINGTSNILLAMHCAIADKRGIPISKLRGTLQNDILKEFVARGTQSFPVKPSMRMTRDTITFCVENMPKYNVMSVSGYHMRELGASRLTSIAFTICAAMDYIKLGTDAGLDVDKVARQITFLSFGGGMEVLKEYSARRAAKKVWASVMRDRLGSTYPGNWIYKELGGILTGYWTATKNRALNNLTRTVIGAALSAMQGDSPLLVEPPYDEALGLGHSLEAQQLCEDAARIILEECKLGDVLDPLAGSYYIEHLTAEYEQEIWDFIKKIDEMGGAAAAVENGWIKKECVRQAYEYMQAMERGEEVQVGVNKYTGPEEINVTTPRTLPYDHLKRMDSEERQLAKLKKIKAERNNDNVRDCLKIIKEKAQDEKVNLIPYFIDAVKEYTSLGEICNTLREVFGEAQI